MEDIKKLKTENESLRILVQQDSLTGLLNRKAMEEKTNQILKQNTPGVFIMIDMDEFKLINDKYGHLMGDKILQEMGTFITYMFFKKDLIGRLGGDEFAVFMPGEYGQEIVNVKMEELQKRIRQCGNALGIRGKLNFTAGAAFAQKGEDFRRLCEKADSAMRVGKRTGKSTLYFYDSSMESLVLERTSPGRPDSRNLDMKYIVQELEEAGNPEGAYCQDYHTFLSFYRLFERLLGRFNMKCHLILITLTYTDGTFVKLEERDFFMEQLRESICFSMRSSDVFTQYSSSQFLVMAPGASQKDMGVIISRIEKAFYENEQERTDILLSYSYYPLKPSASFSMRGQNGGDPGAV